ncbi:MAG: glycogen-binding domain-containing protein [Phycisphaerales bacterium]|nr:glycogen-binding domain-containing protein [Phycisphaerales bacterium]
MVTQTDDGVVQFRMHLPGATRVELLGTFTGWHDGPIDLDRVGGGWFELNLEIEPGDHEFQYLIDSRSWLADYAAGGVRLNRFGTWVSLLHIPARTAQPAPKEEPATIATRMTKARATKKQAA